MVKKSKSRSKSKRTSKSKSRTSHKGLITGLSIGGIAVLIAGALVVLYLTGVLEKIFKKESRHGMPSTGNPSTKKCGKFNYPITRFDKENTNDWFEYSMDDDLNIIVVIKDIDDKLTTVKNHDYSIMDNKLTLNGSNASNVVNLNSSTYTVNNTTISAIPIQSKFTTEYDIKNDLLVLTIQDKTIIGAYLPKYLLIDSKIFC